MERFNGGRQAPFAQKLCLRRDCRGCTRWPRALDPSRAAGDDSAQQSPAVASLPAACGGVGTPAPPLPSPGVLPPWVFLTFFVSEFECSILMLLSRSRVNEMKILVLPLSSVRAPARHKVQTATAPSQDAWHLQPSFPDVLNLSVHLRSTPPPRWFLSGNSSSSFSPLSCFPLCPAGLVSPPAPLPHHTPQEMPSLQHHLARSQGLC